MLGVKGRDFPRIFFGLSLLLFSAAHLSFAAPNDEPPINVQNLVYEYKKPSYYTPERIKAAIRKANGAPVRFFVDTIQQYRLEYLFNFPFIEVYDGLKDLIHRAAVDHATPHKDDEEDIRQIYRSLDVLEMITPRSKLAELTSFIKDQISILEATRPGAAIRVGGFWRTARAKIRKRVGTLHSGHEAIKRLERGEPLLAFPMFDPTIKVQDGDLSDDEELFTQAPLLPSSPRLKEFRRVLEAGIKEQPEIIDSLVAFESEQALRGSRNRITEVVLELEGLAGNGKDTIAQNYTDALMGYRNAYLDHLYPVKISRKEESWTLFGPSSGFRDSENISAFIKFLVRHSGGKYILKSEIRGGHRREWVEKNPGWSGTDLWGRNPHAVVFINEWQAWSRQLNDEVLREILEYGVFPINNPNGGLDRIQVPTKFILASNFNIGMIANRRLDGSRSGKSLGYDELIRRHADIQRDVDRRHQGILAVAGDAAPGTPADSIKGVTEPTLNRIPKNRSFFLRPLSPITLQGKVRDWLKQFSDELASSDTPYALLKFEFTDSLIRFVQEYRYEAEENARPIKGYTDALVMSVITRALTGESDKDPLIPAPKFPQKWQVDIEKNEDGTSTLRLRQIKAGSGKAEAPTVPVADLLLPIPLTVQDKKPNKLSAAEVQKILRLPEEISRNVVASPQMLERATDSALYRANIARSVDDPKNPTRTAKVSLLLGPTSVGKTQWAKALASAASGRPDSLKVLNFGNVLNKNDMTLKVWGLAGSREHRRSEVAQHLDDFTGQPTYLLLDEMSNVQGQDPWFVTYDLIREAEPSQFADNRSRKMGQVDISMAANFTQEWYQSIPSSLPMDLKIFAAQRIYQRALADPEYVQRYLLTKLPQPFLARIGMDNVFLFSPLDFQQIRAIYQMKYQQAVRELEPKPGKIGYYLAVPDLASFEDLMRQFENHSYIFEENGASIDRAMSEGFQRPLETFLIKKGIPDGAHITIKARGTRLLKDPINPHAQNMVFDLHIEGFPEPIKFEVRAQDHRHDPTESDDERVLVAAHEAAHTIVSEALLGHLRKSSHVSIIPGVTNIADQWIVFEGIAQNEVTGKQAFTLDLVLSYMAHLHAGYIGQALVAPKHTHDFGKSNDMQRATELAQRAILEGGLMPEQWGIESLPQGMKLQEFIASLAGDRRVLLNKLVRELMDKAAIRALAVLTRERDTSFARLTVELSQVGDMGPEQLATFFAKNPVTKGVEAPDLDSAKAKLKETLTSQSDIDVVSSHRGVEFAKWFPRSEIKKVAQFQDFLNEQRREMTAKVAAPADLKIIPLQDCEAGLKAAK